MRKTLQDVACYLKQILVPETNEAYDINPVYTNIFTEEQIREGIIALRAFLCNLYDALANQGGKYDTSKKVIHTYENRTGLSVYYPFLHNVAVLLKNIGYIGVFNENKQTLVCNNSIFNVKLPTSKTLECLNFLIDCGFCFDGINIDDKKQKFSDISTTEIKYSKNPITLIGLKTMAVAEIGYGTLDNQDIFLRCDYRILKNHKVNVISYVEDIIKPLPSEIQNFILQLHQHYIEKGMTCVVEIKGFHIYIKYSYKRRDVWGLNLSLNNGYHINVKPVKTDEYIYILKTLHPRILELIAKGYGCGRKRKIGHCDGGCRGLSIELDYSVLNIQEDIMIWLDHELSSLNNK